MCGLKAAQTHGRPFRAAKESSAAFGCTRFLGGPEGPPMFLCGLKAEHFLLIMI